MVRQIVEIEQNNRSEHDENVPEFLINETFDETIDMRTVQDIIDVIFGILSFLWR